ncbi:MAG: ATP-binding cassette domain-containing protein [Planctomyces sp.]|nr:ATP-binding cassette domain-containing protein [Planctomyces sp.]
MNSEPVYKMCQVRRVLSDEFALNIDNLEHARGETLCLIGPTGSGKTTFLKILTGLTPIQRGSIEYNGHQWTGGLGS